MAETDSILETTIRSIDTLKSDGLKLIAIDGRCTSGKSTLAQSIQKRLDCVVFHMDDFFLQPFQRTEERYKTPGGNVDYERFEAEILKPLVSGEKEIKFRSFSCRTQSFLEPVVQTIKPVVIIEGSYSCHPALQNYYDLRIFMTTSYETQIERIKKRNPDTVQIFCEKWIPLEESYFNAYKIKEKCELCFET